MTAEARLVKLEADYWEAAYTVSALPISDPRFDRWWRREDILHQAMREALPDGPEGIMAKWHYFRHSAAIAFQDETTLMQDFADFEAALRHFLGERAKEGGAT